MSDKIFAEYTRTKVWLARPYVEGEDLADVKVSDADKKAGSPQTGDMVVKDNGGKLSLVPAAAFAESFAPAGTPAAPADEVFESDTPLTLAQRALEETLRLPVQDQAAELAAHYLRIASALLESRPQ